MNIYDVNFAKVKEQFKKIVPEYESPINIIQDEISSKIRKEGENFVLDAVSSVGIQVDKDELIKAIQYDREQYRAGFEAGKAVGHNKTIDALAEMAVKLYGRNEYYYKEAMRDAMEIIKKAWLEEETL